MSDITGVNLIADPTAAMRPAVATKILFHGMINGTFSGRSLGTYFSGATEHWTNARRIINGMDRAVIIGGYGKQFYAALSHTV